MKAVLILLLIFGAAITFACDHYIYCHCQTVNGVANDDATKAVCTFTQVYYGAGDPGSPDGVKYLECGYNAGSYNPDITDNCIWSDLCSIVGGGGLESSCHN